CSPVQVRALASQLLIQARAVLGREGLEGLSRHQLAGLYAVQGRPAEERTVLLAQAVERWGLKLAPDALATLIGRYVAQVDDAAPRPPRPGRNPGKDLFEPAEDGTAAERAVSVSASASGEDAD